MFRLWISVSIVFLLFATGWSQLMVKNTGGDLLMEVDNQANVTIGTPADPGRIGIGVDNPDSRLRIEGHAASLLPIFGTYNTSIYAKDVTSSNNEKQVVIEGIGTVLSEDFDSAHLGVQGFLLGGSNHDQWITSASLGYHNTNEGNHLAGVSSNVLDVGGYVLSTDLETAVFLGKNHNVGDNHYGLHVGAEKHLLVGDLLVLGKVGINIGDREPATWLEINGQPYINANNAGIIMKSSDGQCWQVRVNTSGALFTTSVSCP
ncbi:hypothetical protein GF407_07605 [candidate division KSB1 bacterium]|nr:hypothetical protein [candidate division KSB1 bacterium]